MGPEMSPPPSSKKASPAKRTPRKPAARGKWSEETLLTSDKSVLIHEDLVVCFDTPDLQYKVLQLTKQYFTL